MTALRVGEASYWNDMPFQLAPLPFQGRLRRVLTEFFCLVGITIAKAGRTLGMDRKVPVPKKILVVRRGGLGDVLMATPLLRAIRDHFRPQGFMC